MTHIAAVFSVFNIWLYNGTIFTQFLIVMVSIQDDSCHTLKVALWQLQSRMCWRFTIILVNHMVIHPNLCRVAPLAAFLVYYYTTSFLSYLFFLRELLSSFYLSVLPPSPLLLLLVLFVCVLLSLHHAAVQNPVNHFPLLIPATFPRILLLQTTGDLITPKWAIKRWPPAEYVKFKWDWHECVGRSLGPSWQVPHVSVVMEQ